MSQIYTESSRITELVGGVDAMVAMGVPVKVACTRLGLSRDTYYMRKRMLKQKEVPSANGTDSTTHEGSSTTDNGENIVADSSMTN